MQLTSSQQKAVEHIEGPLLVIAGPGSGKTRVITNRIAALVESGVRPYDICAITFTNKAAEEMRQRVIENGTPAGANISTFHSLCVRLLRTYSRHAGLDANFSIYDTADQKKCIKDAIKLCEFDSKNFPPSKMLAAISKLKNDLQGVEAFKELSDDFFSKSLARIYGNYQKILDENNALDFDDLLFKAAFLLRENADVRCELNDRFKFLLVDEYQDTNHAQYQIARGLCIEHGNICVTGDPDQSIYGWRGADIGNILAFEEDWPNAVVVKLQENFRSTANILDLADRLISSNKQRKLKKLIPTIEAGPDVEAKSCEDEQAEAELVAEQVAELVTCGANLNEVAVFYRVNSMSRPIEEAFIQNKIPYQVVRGVEFYNRKEIRDMLAYLKILVNPDDRVALLRIINTPARGIGKTTTERVSDYAVQHSMSFYNALQQAGQIPTISKAAQAKLTAFIDMIEKFKADIESSVADLMTSVFEGSGLLKSLQDSEAKEASSKASAIENVDELINSAGKFDQIRADQDESGGLLDYLQQIALFSDTDAYDAQSGKASLMTLHAAKGLEFDNVFIVGLEEGLLPHDRSSFSADELEEERRLCFVGITRAKKTLRLSLSRYRTVHGAMIRTIPSQFLYEMNIAAAQADTAESDDELADDLRYEDDYSQEIETSGPGFMKNQLVAHKKFGMGKVAEYHDLGSNSTVVVRFNSGQTKTLMVKYAKLIKLNQ